MIKHKFINLIQQISIDKLYAVYDMVLKENYVFEGERHNFWELDYFINGDCCVTADDKIYDCTAGELVLHRPNAFHTAKEIKGNKLHCFMISFSGMGLDYTIPDGKIQIDDSDRNIIENIRKEIMLCFNNYSVSEYTDIALSDERLSKELQPIKNLLELLCLSLRRKGRKIILPPSKNKRAVKYTKYAEFLKENVCSNLSLDQISVLLAESQSSIKSIFKQFTNSGVMDYYNNMRFEHSIKLINSGYSMKEISTLMGFSSQNYFSFFFKRQAGVSPSKYISSSKNIN